MGRVGKRAYSVDLCSPCGPIGGQRRLVCMSRLYMHFTAASLEFISSSYGGVVSRALTWLLAQTW
jgi:hypothetical protein